MKPDPIQLQRLIDGELDRDSINRLLQSAESHSEQWRDIALSFVEDQIWKSEFIDSTSEAQAMGPEQRNSVGGNAMPKSSAHGKLDFWTVSQWLTLAAMLLVMLASGYYLGQSDDSSAGMDIANTVPSIDPGPNPGATQGTSMVNLRPEYHMQLQDPQGAYANTEIPLYDMTTARQMGYQLQPPELPEQLKRSWTSSGYQLKQNVDYISGRLNDGRRFIVPVRTINLTSGQ